MAFFSSQLSRCRSVPLRSCSHTPRPPRRPLFLAHRHFLPPRSFSRSNKRKRNRNKKKVIRSLLGPKKYVIVVEHDLAVLDYLSDFVCCLYGKPGAYGVVTLPFSVREGINVFLAGFVPTENLRFREEALSFKVAVDTSESESAVAAASAAATAAAASSSGKGKGGKGKEKAGEGGDDEASATAVGRGGERYTRFTYPAMTKTQGSFKLTVESGDFTDSEIIVMLGENGTGKTTLIRMLGGLLPPDDDGVEVPQFGVSYKPQKISPKFPGTVRELLHKRIRDAYLHPQFVSDVMRPLLMEPLMDQAVLNLSGGELQRVAITLALGVPADIYLIDEPSAYLDSEQRIIAAKVIKRFIMHAKKTAFIVEHDFIMVRFFELFFPSFSSFFSGKKKKTERKEIQLPPPLPSSQLNSNSTQFSTTGYLPCRPRHRIRRRALQVRHGPPAAVAAYRHELVPQGA